MSNKISIPREALSKLYVDEKLSTRAIARIYNCSQGVILRGLGKHGIEVRNPCKEIPINKESLYNVKEF